MRNRSTPSTVTIFLLRFAALLAVTVAVLLSVSVRASRTPEPAAPVQVEPAADHAQAINSRRYPLRYPDDALHR